MKNDNNYGKQIIAVRAEFLKWDQESMAKRFFLDKNEAFLFIVFFGEIYSINRQTAEVLRCCDGSPAGFNEVLSIYDMLCNAKAAAHLSGEFKTLNNLDPHSNFGSANSSPYHHIEQKLLGKVSELKAACASLGGTACSKADVGFKFDAFPWLPIVFQFWDGDDEFPPKLSFLFDANTLDYIHFETAWYVAGHLLELIEEKL